MTSVTPLIREYSPEPDEYSVVLPLTRWIGVETQNSMPPYLYRYYLEQVRRSRRNVLRVSFNSSDIFENSIKKMSLALVRHYELITQFVLNGPEMIISLRRLL
ncbi:hypothetical protein RUM43_002009 [Polyplax serrata]|uniref:Uncharacterized protein n=1 Tax=Polyplax serrata TaxID=468196 RepID=A0AAN8PLU2_POLSC